MDLNQFVVIAEKECLLTPDRPILVGVSGGPDSLCLVDLLARVQFPLVIAHFDHQLRQESKTDAAMVEAEASRLGFPFILGSQDVVRYAESEHHSLEEAARFLRYHFLFTQAKAHGAQAVAVGHTADDQVETVLMHFLRGAGLSGLRGMAVRSIISEWDDQIPLVRPLLSFWREETVAYCREQNLSPIYDASNQDPSFLRNRLRHELIPYLETYNPQIRRTLWRTSQVLAGDELVLNQALEKAWSACFVSQAEGMIALNSAKLRSLSPGLLRAVLRKAATALLPALRDVDYSAIERAERFIEAPHAGQVDLVQGLRLFAENDNLLIHKIGFSLPTEFWPQVDFSHERPLEIPGCIDLPLDWRLSAQWVEEGDLARFSDSASNSPWEAWLDAAQIPDQVCLRSMRPGDRFQPLGMHGHSIKLSDFWINEKLPRRARAAWPLIVSANQILWVPGFRLADPQRMRKNTQKALYLHLSRK